MNYSQAQHKNNIKEFQEYLYAISFYNDNIIRVIPDGIYGRETMLAVKSFQKAYNLDITGEVNRVTWEKAVEVYRDYVGAPPEVLDVFPYNTFVLQKGNQGSLIYMLQVMLYDISKTFPNIPTPTINGIYDAETVATVKAMQNKARLNQTGSTNKLTWNVIVKTYLHLDSSLKY